MIYTIHIHKGPVFEVNARNSAESDKQFTENTAKGS